MSDIGQIKNDLADFVEIMRRDFVPSLSVLNKAMTQFSAKRLVFTNAQHREYKKMKKRRKVMKFLSIWKFLRFFFQNTVPPKVYLSTKCIMGFF